MRIEEYGTGALIDCGDVAYTFEVAENPREFATYKTKDDSLQWDNDNFSIGEYRVHPYGDQNDLPEQIRLVIQNHYMASSQLTKKIQMMWGQGPQLYKEIITEEGDLKRKWEDDKEVWKWINSFDGLDYLLRCAKDYEHMQGVFTKFYQARGSRVGKNKIAKLEHVQMSRARLASKKKIGRTEPTHVVVTDWEFTHVNSITEYKAYKKFDFNNPFAERNSIYYSNMYSFCTDYYTVPDLYGSLEWLRRSTAIPYIFKALSKNAMNVKYHIQSPAEFWRYKKNEIKDRCKDNNQAYNEKLFKTYKRNFLKKVAEVLSGEENTGKFWHSEKVINVEGHDIKEQGWEIKPIDQNLKEFFAAHINLSDKADRVIASTFGLHPSLGNVSANDKSDSGSEQGYAFKNYINSGVDIPEMIVCKAINYALQANFPQKGLKIGFYRTPTKLESETTPKERIINN